MAHSIPKTEGAEELLKLLLTLPPDLSALEETLKDRQFSRDDVSRAGYDFAEKCRFESLDYHDEHDDLFRCTEQKVIPGLHSTDLLPVFKLLLRYGLDPNAVCDETSVMNVVADVFNEYVSADTLLLLLEHGGDPDMEVDGESLSDRITDEVIFAAFEQRNRAIYDSWVHCWFVLLGYTGNQIRGEDVVTVFSHRRNETELPEFEIRDLIDHRNYTFGLTNVPERGENWSLHIFDKRTCWEVARL